MLNARAHLSRHGTSWPSLALPIPIFLKRVRALVYQHEARRAVWYALAAMAAIAVVLTARRCVDRASRATALAVLGRRRPHRGVARDQAVVLGVIVRAAAGRRSVARALGRARRREVASDLLSAVELANAPSRPGAPSPALVDALIEATSLRLDSVDPTSLIDPLELRRARRWAAVAIALNLALVVTGRVDRPRLRGIGVRRARSVRRRPAVGGAAGRRLEAVLSFPAYSRRPKLPCRRRRATSAAPRHHGRAQGPRAGPAATAELIIEPVDRGEPRSIAPSSMADQLTCALIIDHSARYRFAITSPLGEAPRSRPPPRDRGGARSSARRAADGAADPLDVTNLRRVELAYVIEDRLRDHLRDWFGRPARTRARSRSRSRRPGPARPAAAGPSARAAARQVDVGTSPRSRSRAAARSATGSRPRTTTRSAVRTSDGRASSPQGGEPRERHEETLGRQQDVAEKILKNLGGR